MRVSTTAAGNAYAMQYNLSVDWADFILRSLAELMCWWYGTLHLRLAEYTTSALRPLSASQEVRCLDILRDDCVKAGCSLSTALSGRILASTAHVESLGAIFMLQSLQDPY